MDEFLNNNIDSGSQGLPPLALTSTPKCTVPWISIFCKLVKDAFRYWISEEVGLPEK
jgi:hypothetical protein